MISSVNSYVIIREIFHSIQNHQHATLCKLSIQISQITSSTFNFSNFSITSTISKMSQSNVGNAQVYQADDQRTVPDSQLQEEKKENRFHEGKENSHLAQDSSMFNPTSAFHLCPTSSTLQHDTMTTTNQSQRTSALSRTSSSVKRSVRTRMTTTSAWTTSLHRRMLRYQRAHMATSPAGEPRLTSRSVKRRKKSSGGRARPNSVPRKN